MLIALVGALAISVAPRPSQDVSADDGSGVEGVPAIFVSDSETGVLRGYNVNGDLIWTDSFEGIFDADPTILEGLSVDFVTQPNGADVSGAGVVAADADTDKIFAKIGTIFVPNIGFSIDIDFDAGDRLLTGNLTRSNDWGPTKLFPDFALDEILIVRDDDGVIDVVQFDSTVTGGSLDLVDSFTFDFESEEGIAVGDIGLFEANSGNTASEKFAEFIRFGQDGLDEIIVVDPDRSSVRFFDHTGTELGTAGFINFDRGDRIVTGNVNGVGGDEVLVAHPATGTIDIFDVDLTGRGDPLLSKPKSFTINANFGPDDQIDLADINGNGADEILVAQAETGNVDVFRYDIVTQEIVTEPSLPISYTPGDIFTVTPIRYPDIDGDGLFDHWETHGVDVNGDGTVDVDLPSMGADPRHKDIFVEYDYVAGQEPSRAAVQLVKEAFAKAPVYAGTRRNPDREPGINLWIDTGFLSEDGSRVGDALGGGERIPSSAVPADGICGLGPDFDTIKSTHFNAMRTPVFRYALSIAKPADCTELGGQGELSGNDFVEHYDLGIPGVDTIDEAQVIIHELGHNLSLGHGGFEGLNCKPNYISVMNYNYIAGIPRQDGSRIIDYSPARVTTERADAPLPDLVENDLDETAVLDPTDTQNLVVFSGPKGAPLERPANKEINWNDNDVIDTERVMANIDNVENFNACRNDDVSKQPFKGHNDWANIMMTVRNSESSAAGAVVAPPFDEPSIDEVIALKRDLNTADLAITQVAEPDPAVASEELTYTLTITNNGPNPANDVQIIDTLPDGVIYQSGSAGCGAADGEVTCSLPIVKVGESRDVTITVLIDGALGLDEPGPVLITNTATVSDPAEVAVDPEPANNTSSLETEVQIQADLELVSFQPASTPVELVVGQPALIEFETVVANHGPFGPVTATFDVTDPTSGPIIAGLSSLTRADELAAGEERTLSGTVILICSEPGVHDVAIVNTVGLREAEVVDPDPTNNAAAAEISVECLFPVAINIKPGSTVNPVNLNSQVPVALLTTTAGQYNVPVDITASLIDPASIQFGARDVLLGVADPQGAEPRHRGGHVEDALELDESTRDGDFDLILHFKAAESGLAAGDVEACLRATITVDRVNTLEVFGCDAVTIRP